MKPNLERMLVEPGRSVAELWDREIGEAFKLLALRVAATQRDPEAQLNLWITEIDRLLSAQLDELLHHPDFQQLESAWRGLWYLVDQTFTPPSLKFHMFRAPVADTCEGLQIRVMQCTKKELREDLAHAEEFDQSKLFRAVYEAEYGCFGGQPYGVLIGDYEFCHSPEDVSLLGRLAEIAAAAHAPFLSAVSPVFLAVERFTLRWNIHELASVIEGEDYRLWREFRASEDSRYVGLCAPRILLRRPYGAEAVRTEGFNYEEQVAGNPDNYLWGNAAHALGTCITRAFANYGWLATIRGIEGGGMVEGLRACDLETRDALQSRSKRIVEVALNDRQVYELSDMGFIPLLQARGQDYAAFIAAQSCQRPKRYNTNEANASAQLPTELQYLLCISRFTQTLKVIARDKFGSFMDRESCERWFNMWIQTYVHPNPAVADQYDLASMPLADARVDVEEEPGRPGLYRAVAYLSPHFQLNSLNVAPRFVVQLPRSFG